MPGDIVNFPLTKYLVHFKFAMESIGAIEEFDGRHSIGAQDKAVLPRSGAKEFQQPAMMPSFVLDYAGIRHKSFPSLCSQAGYGYYSALRGFVMQPSLATPQSGKQSWTYVTLAVIDGSRRLKPCEVSCDRLWFAEPPHLTSSQIEIILTNGDVEQRQMATVLPHDANDTQIPIRLVTEQPQ